MAYDRASDTYKPIDWDAAFAVIGEVLRELPDPNMAEFIFQAGLPTRLPSFSTSSRANMHQQSPRLLQYVPRGDQCWPAGAIGIGKDGVRGRLRSL